MNNAIKGYYFTKDRQPIEPYHIYYTTNLKSDSILLGADNYLYISNQDLISKWLGDYSHENFTKFSNYIDAKLAYSSMYDPNLNETGSFMWSRTSLDSGRKSTLQSIFTSTKEAHVFFENYLDNLARKGALDHIGLCGHAYCQTTEKGWDISYRLFRTT